MSGDTIKTIPGSLIAQGLSGLNDVKIVIFWQTAKLFQKNFCFYLKIPL